MSDEYSSKGVLPGKKGPRLLFSLKQIEYLSYWIAATGYGASANDAHPIVPIPSSHSVILPEQLLEVVSCLFARTSHVLTLVFLESMP